MAHEIWEVEGPTNSHRKVQVCGSQAQEGSDTNRPMDDDGRTVRKPGGISLALEDLGERFSERRGESRPGAPRVNGRIDRPARVVDAVFDGRAVALARVSPFTVRQEVLERPRNERLAPAVGLHAENAVPVSYTHLRAHETPEHLVCRLL